MEDVRITRAVAAVLYVFVEDVGAQRHGYELMRLTAFPSGKIYPILARLLAAGWLEATMEHIDPVKEARPPRRLYRLSERGITRARQGLAAFYQEIAPARPSSQLLRPEGRLA
ncbi:helix-turn-helix transcriptional regulator [Actinoplanes sp. NPDC051633]|uniref:PadR family transcriptional regulator n=1 Tax=Actinoplanes sp. NPDC051633 TaxID=3155670 RepID=UPI003420528C